MGLDNGKQPIVDGSSKSIVQIGVVVKDAVQTAKNYSRVFGIESWENPSNSFFHYEHDSLG